MSGDIAGTCRHETHLHLPSNRYATFSSRLPRGVRRLFRLTHTPERAMRDVDEEIRLHIEMRIAELRARWMSEVDAEREALRRFGDTEEFRAWSARRAKQRSRRNAVVEWLSELTQDIRFAFRQFRKAPSFTAIAVLTLALGIGANTAIFSVVHHLLLAPLPYPNGNRIVTPMQEDDRGHLLSADRELVKAWRARTHTIDAFAAAEEMTFSMSAEGIAAMIPNARITSNFLPLLGVQPVLGRGFTPEDEQPGCARVAMISYGRWQLEYGGRKREYLAERILVRPRYGDRAPAHDDHALATIVDALEKAAAHGDRQLHDAEKPGQHDVEIRSHPAGRRIAEPGPRWRLLSAAEDPSSTRPRSRRDNRRNGHRAIAGSSPARRNHSRWYAIAPALSSLGSQ